jgi:hypothetical protein
MEEFNKNKCEDDDDDDDDGDDDDDDGNDAVPFRRVLVHAAGLLHMHMCIFTLVHAHTD